MRCAKLYRALRSDKAETITVHVVAIRNLITHLNSSRVDNFCGKEKGRVGLEKFLCGKGGHEQDRRQTCEQQCGEAFGKECHVGNSAFHPAVDSFATQSR
jgi:hypothetical protein